MLLNENVKETKNKYYKSIKFYFENCVADT